MKHILIAVLSVLALAVLAVGLGGCIGAENAAARRAAEQAAAAAARADQTRAEAEAYQTRQQADTAAASERAAIRQMERDAAHERALEMLPYVLVLVGGLLLAALGGLLFWDLRQRAYQPAPHLAELRQLQRQLERLEEYRQLDAEHRNRLVWHVLAQSSRRGELPAGDRRVTVYDDRPAGR